MRTLRGQFFTFWTKMNKPINKKSSRDSILTQIFKRNLMKTAQRS
uniref:Uncharacterized protein n=1 Tax=Rhizophora mucronata TaxID=61149 RepID=A0A2P2KB82_RHIMU